jgi:hypothetical protein
VREHRDSIPGGAGPGSRPAAGHLTTAVRPAPRHHIRSAVKAVVMARKRRSPTYAGALAEPIYMDAVSDEPADWIEAQLTEKIALLCTHYRNRIDPSGDFWWQLAVRLALDNVPGLQISFRPKRGRHPTWKAGLGLDLVRAVQDVKSQTGMRTQDAIRKLQKDKPGTWGRYTVPNLCARYREAKRGEERFRKAVERARERVALGQPLPLDLLVDLLPTDEN